MKHQYAEVRVTVGGESKYLVTRNLRDLKTCFPIDAVFRVIGPWDTPNPVLDVDGAYRRPTHTLASVM